jgi:hypothetical protein
MKAIISILPYLLAGAVAFGQGTVGFVNKISGQVGAVDAPFFDDGGVRLEGPRYVAQLYAWKPQDGFVPVGKPVPFATNGYFDGGAVVVPFLPGASPVWVQVRAWQTDSGAGFEQAALAGGWAGLSGVLFLPQAGVGGVPPSEPARLIGLKYPGSPLVVRQPQPQTKPPGERATLSVIASSGVQMSYQWYQDQGDRPDGLVVGATNATYTTPELRTNTTFWVNVTNTTGSVLSDRVIVTVVAAAPRLNLQRATGLSSLTLEGLVGLTYRIEFTTNLSATNWTSLLGLSLHTSPFTFIDSGASNSPARFYRVVVP